MGLFRQAIGHHLAPCSFCQRTWTACSRAIGGQGFTLPQNYQRPSGWEIYRGKADTADQKVLPVVCNGQCCSYDDGLENARKFSEANGDCSAYFAYQSTHGFVRDTLASLCMLCGVWTRHVAVAHSALQAACEEASTIDGGYVMPVVHSRGGLSFHLASQKLSSEQKAMCDVITVGSAKLIGDKGFGSVLNIVDRRDGVTHLTQGLHCCAAMFGKSSYSVKFVGDYKGMPFIEHAFTNPAYMEAVSMRIRDIRKGREP